MEKYSYKCRFECLRDFGAVTYLMQELERDDIHFMNNVMTQSLEFEWEFDSNNTLEQIISYFEDVDAITGDLHIMISTLNYKDKYTGERLR
jgi:hypothetical protein